MLALPSSRNRLRVADEGIIIVSMANENIDSKDLNKTVVDDLKEYFQAEGEASGIPSDAYMFAYDGDHPWRSTDDALPEGESADDAEAGHRQMAFGRMRNAIADANGFHDAEARMRGIALNARTPGESMMALRALQALQTASVRFREITIMDMPSVMLRGDGIMNALADFATPVQAIVGMMKGECDRLTSESFVRESYEAIDGIVNVDREWIIEHCWLDGVCKAERERRFDECMKGKGVPWGLVNRDMFHLLADYIIGLDNLPIELELIEDIMSAGNAASASPDAKGAASPDAKNTASNGNINGSRSLRPKNGFATPERIAFILAMSGDGYIRRHGFQPFIELMAFHPDIMQLGMDGVITLVTDHFDEYGDVDMPSLSRRGTITYLLIASIMGIVPNSSDKPVAATASM